MSEPQEERAAKYAWTRGAMNGDNAAIISALLETLPGTKSLDGVSMAQLEQARRYMAELWGRVSLSTSSCS